MKKILFVCMVFCLSACESWLDVSPKSLVKNEELFASESGFQTAMFGVYTSMASSGLYGEKLTMGFMDMLVNYYNIPFNHHYYYVALYNYKEKGVVSICDEIWLNMYRTIMNCNNLLENMEGKEGLFAKGHYPVMKGEMLGTRALLHFDLLRMFAPSFAEGKDLPAIPYVDRLDRKPFPQLTVAQVMDRIIADCKAALEVLKDSEPWIVEGTDRSGDRFYENRRERMNYYAVRALLARVYLYAGNKDEAGKIAGELIQTQGVGIISPVFSLYSDKIEDNANSLFDKQEGSVFIMPDYVREEIYEVEKYQSDNRSEKWVPLQPGSESVFLMKKYVKANIVPVIGMNEVYYIYAECCGQEKDGIDALNKIRNAYGIPAQQNLQVGEVSFKNELQKEYRKSFLGEGQFFYFLKRTDVSEIPGAAGVKDPRKVFTLPMPEAELEFGSLINQ